MDKVNTSVPAEPRGAEQYRSNLNIPELLNDNAILREQLTTLHEFSENAVNLAASCKVSIDSLEAALLSAQKEIKELKKRLGEE